MSRLFDSLYIDSEAPHEDPQYKQQQADAEGMIELLRESEEAESDNRFEHLDYIYSNEPPF